MAFLTVHIPSGFNVPPVRVFPASDRSRNFVALDFGGGEILCSPETALAYAEEILRALRPSEIWGAIASEEATRAALEASRQ